VSVPDFTDSAEAHVDFRTAKDVATYFFVGIDTFFLTLVVVSRSVCFFQQFVSMCLSLIAIQIFKNRSDKRVGFIAIEKQSVKLDLIPPTVVLLEEFVIIATILLVSRKKRQENMGLQIVRSGGCHGG
jgi:hypothetical protein